MLLNLAAQRSGVFGTNQINNTLLWDHMQRLLSYYHKALLDIMNFMRELSYTLKLCTISGCLLKKVQVYDANQNQFLYDDQLSQRLVTVIKDESTCLNDSLSSRTHLRLVCHPFGLVIESLVILVLHVRISGSSKLITWRFV